MAKSALRRSLTDAEIEWLDSLTLSDSATTAYRGEIGRLAAYCASEGVLAIHRLKAKHWIAYTSCLMEDRSSIAPKAKPLKPSSALQAVRITRSFLLFCARRRWIDWDPTEVDPSSQFAQAVDQPAFALEKLPAQLRRVLTSEAFAEDVRQARKHFALGLGFWGALAPREIALLKVGDLRLPSRRRAFELHCSWRSLPVVLPVKMRSLWHRYRDFREKDEGHELSPTSPLIANLRDGGELHPWSAWALMRFREHDEDDRAGPSNSRLLRTAYVATTAANAARDMDIVRSQVGRKLSGAGNWEESERRHLLDALHDAASARLTA